MMGRAARLNLYVGNILTAGSGAADFAGTLNISNLAALSSGTTELMAYGSRSGSFGTINGLTGSLHAGLYRRPSSTSCKPRARPRPRTLWA